MDGPSDDELIHFSAKGNIPPHAIEAVLQILQPFTAKPANAPDHVQLSIRDKSTVNAHGMITWETFKFFFFRGAKISTDHSKYQQIRTAYNALGVHILNDHGSHEKCSCPLKGTHGRTRPRRDPSGLDVAIDPESLLGASMSGDLEKLTQFGVLDPQRPLSRSAPMMRTKAGTYCRQFIDAVADEFGRSLGRA